MYDNQTAGAAMVAGNARDTRPLETIAVAVNRVNSAQVTIQRFIDRWHGETPKEPMAGGDSPQTVTTPHAINLERLFQAIDRLETRVQALDQIG